MIGLFALVFGSYFFCMLLIFMGFLKLEKFKYQPSIGIIRFTIIIPFRNEAENLPKLVYSLQNIKYPRHLFEIIFVDDASEDDSVSILANCLTSKLNVENPLNFRIIENSRFSKSPKKDAITKAVKISHFEWIVTTDADCAVPSTWLNCLDNYIQNKEVNMICGPVFYAADANFIQKFQQLDGFSLQAVTIGGFGLQKTLLCNGANLAYKKEVFQQLSGFEGNNHLASGDDIFMMEKISKAFPNSVKFIKSADMVVTTNGQKTWKAIINQRIRWASKTSKTKGFLPKLLGIIVFFINLLLIIGLFVCIFQSHFLLSYGIFILIKLGVDYVVLAQSSKFFNKQIHIFLFFKSAIIYPLLITITVIASFSGRYNWKGRNFDNKV